VHIDPFHPLETFLHIDSRQAVREEANDIQVQIRDHAIGDDEYRWSRVEVDHADTGDMLDPPGEG
jgi:hypothetical protein